MFEKKQEDNPRKGGCATPCGIFSVLSVAVVLLLALVDWFALVYFGIDLFAITGAIGFVLVFVILFLVNKYIDRVSNEKENETGA